MTRSFAIAVLRGVSIAACMLTGVSAHARDSYRFTATPAFSLTDPTLRMPTDIALGPDGTTFLADGVNDRILAFDANGAPLRSITEAAGTPLSRPTGLDVDTAGRLWVADAGNARIVALDAAGNTVRELRAPTPSGASPPEITDIAVTRDGARLWYVDNVNDAFGYFALNSDAQERFGQHGEAPGQLFRPFMIAVSAKGEPCISDVLNGRVQRFDAAGRPAGPVATYGLDLGNLYRPKGLAVDAEGLIWVADSVLGVVQVFQPGGGLVDVVRDSEGRPLKLEAPMGIALDAGGALYVAELGADRARKFTITRNAGAAAVQAPPTKPSAQPRTCTACHFEWLEPLASGKSSAFLAPPENPRELPSVSRPERCLSCHDGSVVDSRRRIWMDHGHRGNLALPAGMQIPPQLPLADGKMVCRTCHTAHNRAGGAETIATAVYLRVKKDPAELCVTCHAEKSDGRDARMHPAAVSSASRPPGAATQRTNAAEASCLDCHVPHSAENALLRAEVSSNAACIKCHETTAPGRFSGGESAPHPTRTHLSAEQTRAAAGFGKAGAPNDQLRCVTCHSMHSAKTGQFLLSFELRASAGCVACHADKQALLSSAHDLRARFADNANDAGLTVSEAGACSACHMVHRRARDAAPAELDPGARCVTCHQSGHVAASKALADVNHPKTACTECHNPHSAAQGDFLKAAPAELCDSCHGDKSGMHAGPHDFGVGSAAVASQAATTSGGCLGCHTPHGDAERGLFRAGIAAGFDRADGACIACHSGAAWQADSAHAALHPRIAAVHADGAGSQRDARPTTGDQIRCRSCHDPHADASRDGRLLRVEAGAAAQTLCTTCHTDMRHITWTGHDETALASAGLTAAACAPCHSVHANPRDVATHLLRTAEAAHSPNNETGSTADSRCVGCHRAGGPANLPAAIAHPVVAMTNASARDASLPLFDAQGTVAATGVITCRTCHVPHGRTLGEDPASAAFASVAERRAARAQLRSFEPPNLCTGCHGFEGLWRFLYFHDPARRRSPSMVDQTPSIWRPRAR